MLDNAPNFNLKKNSRMKPMRVIQFRQTYRKSRGVKIHRSKNLNFKKPLDLFIDFLNVFMDYTKHLALSLLQMINYINFSLKFPTKTVLFKFFSFSTFRNWGI